MGSKLHEPRPKILESLQVFLSTCGDHRVEAGASLAPAIFLTSYLSYRSKLVQFKSCARILIILLLAPHFSQAMELKALYSSNRLTIGSEILPPNVNVLDSVRCGKSTKDLILTFNSLTADASKALVGSLKIVSPYLKPCDTRADHSSDGSLRVVFSYKSPKNKTLIYQTSRPNGEFVVDHWFGKKKSADLSRKISSELPDKRKKSNIIKIENLNDLAGIKDIELRTFTNADSPYGDISLEKNLGINSKPLRLQSLKVPLIEFDLKKTEVAFSPLEFPYREFTVTQTGLSRGLKDSIQAIFDMAQRGDWVRASAAHDVLLSSKLSREYNKLGFFVTALDGFLKIQSAHEKDGSVNNRLFSGGINIWREALIRQALLKEGSDPYLDFMFLESIRHLYKQKDYYTALSVIDETQGIKWSPMVEERVGYVRGIALMSLGMLEKAKDSFENYIKERKNLSIRDVSDRRLLPSAAFHLADLEFMRGNYQTSLKKYQEAMAYLPGTQTINMEGYIYPRSLVSFSSVLFNLSEAHLRLGEHAKALKRLRTLIAFDVEGTNHGIAMFRIAEILSFLGSDKTKVAKIYDECAFRYTGFLAGGLCEINLAALDQRYEARKFWPRLESTFAKFEQSKFRASWHELDHEDKLMYSALLKANFYLNRNRPLIALSALDKVRSLESSKYLKDWNYEFSAVAFLGAQRDLLSEGDNKSVILAYEKRKNNLFLYVDRPDVLFAISQAYAEQGLWDESKKAFIRAEELLATSENLEARPYQYSVDEQKYLNARISNGLYQNSKISRQEVEQSLSMLSSKHLPSNLLLISFAQESGNLELEIKGWRNLEQYHKLDWAQIKSYSSALINKKMYKENRDLLEKHVGVWFYQKDKSLNTKPDSNLSLSLVFRLAEARERDGAIESSLRIYDYMSRLPKDQMDAETPKELILYKMGKTLASKKDYKSAREAFDSAIALAPASVWGKLSSTEVFELNRLEAEISSQAR